MENNKSSVAPIMIGRHAESEILRECVNSSRSEFVIVCGRRRIGKTFLVDQFFGNSYDFSYVGKHRTSTRTQLGYFAKAIQKYSGKRQPSYADWYEAFDALESYLEAIPPKGKKIVFIDEMPWIDTQRSSFVSALENFWNGWASRRYDIVLVATGSATSWMADKLIENQGGLHNRITRRIYLEPFTLRETEEYFQAFDATYTRYDILQCYMFTGGIPFYLSLMNTKWSIAQNIDRLCFAKNAPLRNEYNELYSALFSHVDSYIKVIELLYAHKAGLTRKEISSQVKLNGFFLNTLLTNLLQCDFIDTYEMFGKKNTLVYRLVDFYTIFYFKFIANQHNKDDEWWSHNLENAGVRSWMGLSFELVCMRHHKQIKKALGISGVPTSVSTWKCAPDPSRGLQGAQIDMLIERADHVVHLCEMKFSEEEFHINNEYEMRLRNRMGIFKQQTKTRNALVHTFVTTFGVGEGKHSSIVHSEVTMDDLFVGDNNAESVVRRPH